MVNREQLFKQGVEEALKVRRKTGYGITQPICVYDIAEKLNVDVWFIKAPSLEGMYRKTPPAILISAERPYGRQVFTCAHELGHHIFNHGSHIDELAQKSNIYDPQEFLVDSFAATLLMPKMAILQAFKIREWDIQKCQPRQVFAMAHWFGVGYDTLITQMQSYNIIDPQHAKYLRRTTPKEIRQGFDDNSSGDLFLIDYLWTERALDVQIGDKILAPFPLEVDNDSLAVNETNRNIVIAQQSGRARIIDPVTQWSLFVRVAKRNFTGRSIYRHLEDCDE